MKTDPSSSKSETLSSEWSGVCTISPGMPIRASSARLSAQEMITLPSGVISHIDNGDGLGLRHYCVMVKSALPTINYRSVAPFPAIILSLNLAMRAMSLFARKRALHFRGSPAICVKDRLEPPTSGRIIGNVAATLEVSYVDGDPLAH